MIILHAMEQVGQATVIAFISTTIINRGIAKKQVSESVKVKLKLNLQILNTINNPSCEVSYFLTVLTNYSADLICPLMQDVQQHQPQHEGSAHQSMCVFHVTGSQPYCSFVGDNQPYSNTPSHLSVHRLMFHKTGSGNRAYL